ncbi:universal stress protein [Streptomyces sp. 7-21]|uniref:universal stress protein n=1 Tax=Streptomyces sp. 7-21 TaxID=2802283 RepID=UPI0027DC6F15|nr:universal stress protein [Streptomyces sp. 7-21]
MTSDAPVVVGVDGSPSSLAAVGVAAAEARMRRCPLRVVHAFTPPTLYVPRYPQSVQAAERSLRAVAAQALTDAEQRARELAPGIDVSGEIVTGESLTVLRDRSRGAALLVVGSRGMGSFAGLLLGSTSAKLAAHAQCPVMVVREEPSPGLPVLLGADGSPAGEAAVAFAFEEAALRGTKLVALHAWTPWTVEGPPPPDRSMPYANEPGVLEAGEERLLAETLAGHLNDYPDLTVERRVVRDNPRKALLKASSGAGLLVVGARGHGGFASLLIGSVSQAMLHHAECPVAVVRP